jgi:hypothetical protein
MGNLSFSAVFKGFEVILSAAPPRLFQTKTLKVEGPEDFSFYPYCIREFSQYLGLFLRHDPSSWFS